ncbi:Rrf2 family transcriptional regulator [Vibrio sp. JC009]|uniref:RrF2 family transcriptional regulator n=1 Tax=Vibrio sp. JC009 TaxID=2912314 RepID=UPI0023AECC17|nr:Rrf2 family transcriptional regulator [Vibrio sp. JC009]WED23933.1 Rrf2 family transcriptional regulator [Vibrio sp. JC009]
MNSLINISEGTSLAIHGLGLLAQQAPQRLSVKAAAQRLSASEAHLAKVFGKLQKQGWVNSTRGPAGGFSLSVSPDELTFLDVYELFQEKIHMNACPLGRSCCPFDDCMFDGRIHKLNLEVYNTLKNTTITDLNSADKERR